MANNEKVVKAIIDSVGELNKQLPKEDQLGTDLDEVLFGKGGKLDSMGLINLVVITEQKIFEEIGITIILTDEQAMSQDNSPLRTIGTLIDYVSSIVEAKSIG